MSDAAYRQGVAQGAEYRRQNGDAFERVDDHNRALAEARRGVDASRTAH